MTLSPNRPRKTWPAAETLKFSEHKHQQNRKRDLIGKLREGEDNDNNKLYMFFAIALDSYPDFL